MMYVTGRSCEKTMLRTTMEEPLAVSADGARLTAAQEVEAYFQPRWYAAYTRANHERRVADQLAERDVENFLPQYESVHKRKDRKVRVQLPLFPGYVFVHLALQNRLRVLQVPGVAWLVGFGGKPVSLPEGEFARIREFTNKGFRAQPHPYPQAGQRVRVRRGPLEGMEGIVERRRNGSRLVISLEVIQRAMAVEVSGLDLEPAAPARVRTASASAHG
jgi:transcription antitermination factor NusG